MKDAGIKDMLNKIYHADFTEVAQPKKIDHMVNPSDDLLWQDQKPFKLMEKQMAKEDRPYQLPLPFKNNFTMTSASNNEIARFEGKIFEGSKLLQRLM